MTWLKFDVDTTTWVTREGDSEDEWDRDSTDGSVEILSCKLSDIDAYDSLPIDFSATVGDEIWLVWAKYSTGDSFGTDGGKYELCSVFQDEQSARKEEKRLEEVTDYSVPWTGFFEDLDYVTVERMVIQS